MRVRDVFSTDAGRRQRNERCAQHQLVVSVMIVRHSPQPLASPRPTAAAKPEPSNTSKPQQPSAKSAPLGTREPRARLGALLRRDCTAVAFNPKTASSSAHHQRHTASTDRSRSKVPDRSPGCTVTSKQDRKPRTQPPNRKPRTANPESQTPNPKTQTPNPKPKPRTQTPNPTTRNTAPITKHCPCDVLRT